MRLVTPVIAVDKSSWNDDGLVLGRITAEISQRSVGNIAGDLGRTGKWIPDTLKIEFKCAPELKSIPVDITEFQGDDISLVEIDVFILVVQVLINPRSTWIV